MVTAKVDSELPAGRVVIEDITGDDGRLPRIAERNCVGIAAIETIKLLGDVDCGISLTLNKVNIRLSSSLYIIGFTVLGTQQGVIQTISETSTTENCHLHAFE